MAESDRSARPARLLSAIITGLALTFAVIAYAINPARIGVDALRLLAIAVTAFLTARGVRWARLLLIALTGFATAFAVLTAWSSGRAWAQVGICVLSEPSVGRPAGSVQSLTSQARAAAWSRNTESVLSDCKNIPYCVVST